ncbi:FmdB family zinc ribbon protein [Ottowia sp. VDI28]|uniref:FmdB family zinc ribbon protein n=1 Tax=Ottowia sp. VDI28 TaxID=3133968 RepID=UPI003C2FA9E9
MPLYDYTCESCGRFSAARPVREFDAPAPCPGCGVLAPRALTAPAVLGRTARQQRAPDDAGYRRLQHAAGCGCCRTSSSP